jgi:hypothetical protein
LSLFKRLKKTVKHALKFKTQVEKLTLHPTHKGVEQVKHGSKVVTRNIARSTEKPLVYASGAVTAVASYFFTPVGGAVVGSALSGASYYAGSTAARAKGKHGLEARHEGRVERKKVIQASLIGMSVGGAAAGIGAAVAGSGTAAGVGSGAAAIVGPDAAGSISSIGSVAIGAAGKVVPQIIAFENQQHTGNTNVTATSGTGVSLGIGAGAAPGQTTTTATGATTPWGLIALGGVGLMAAMAS